MTEQETEPAGLPSQVTYEPLPSIYRAFAAGASPYAIITETIDNSIDFVRRQALNDEYYPETLTVDIRFEPTTDTSTDEQTDEEQVDDSEKSADSDSESESVTGRLIITDNAGGVPPEGLAKFFQLGHSDAPPEGIGRFGVGAKRLIGIGDHIRYESHAHGREIAAGFEVDAQKLEGNAAESSRNTYRSDVYEVSNLEEGKTRIVVEDLNKGVWERLCGVKDDQIDKGAENSLWRLKETYEHFLRDEIQIDPTAERHEGSIELDLNWGIQNLKSEDVEDGKETVLHVAEDVSPPDPATLSYVPFDGLWPRKYEDMPFANDSGTPVEECIRVSIEVGLMPQSNPDKAGLTVTMNNRNVLFRDTDNDLFSTRYLGKFRESAGHGRLHCIVSIHGNAKDMPWSDTKDALDGTQQVTEEILNVTENALYEYRRQTYANFPDWMLEVYSIQSLKERGYYDNEGIRTTGERIPKANSKVNSPRFNKKPGETRKGSSYRQYPTRDHLIRTAFLHGALQIRCDAAIDEELVPAYSNYFETEYEGPEPKEIDPSELPSVEDYISPLKSDGEKTIPLIEDIKELATFHADENKRLTEETDGVPSWFLPRYLEELESTNKQLDALSEIKRFDFAIWREQHSDSEEVPIEESTQTQSSETSKAGTLRNQPSGKPITSDEEMENKVESEDSPIAPSGDTSVRRAPISQPADQDMTRQGTETEPTRFSESSSTGSAVPSPPGLGYGGDYYEATEEDMSSLLEHLDLDEDVPPQEIFKALDKALEHRAKLAEQLRDLSRYVNIEGLLGEPPAVEDESSNE